MFTFKQSRDTHQVPEKGAGPQGGQHQRTSDPAGAVSPQNDLSRMKSQHPFHKLTRASQAGSLPPST